MDGAVIDADCIVAAPSFVRAGFEGRAESLLAGIPAEVKRMLGECELRWKVEETQDYLDLTPRCQAAIELVEALTEPQVRGSRFLARGRHMPPHEIATVLTRIRRERDIEVTAQQVVDQIETRAVTHHSHVADVDHG